MLDILREQVIRNYRIKKTLFNLLNTPIFTKNPLYKFLYLKNIRKKIKFLEKKPIAVIIENTNCCNISCIFCANEQMKRKRGFISDDLFKSIVNQCTFHKIPNVVIQGFGEPLLDENYSTKIAYAKDKGIENVYCVTNAILLNKEVSKKLIESSLDYLCISIDAASPEVYEQIHRSDKFSEVVRNIEELIFLKKKMQSAKPFIEVRFKDFQINQKELHKFIRKYRGLVDKINIYMNITNWPGSSIRNNLPAKMALLKFPCYNLWSTLFIAYDGGAALCCQDYECRKKIGDAVKEGIMDIWNGSQLKNIRETHLKGNYNKINICSDCVINTHYLSPWWQ